MASEPLRITVVLARGPRQTHEVTLTLVPPCSVHQALRQSGLLQRFPEIDSPHILLGVWGRRVGMAQLLRDMDRVEIYRPLRVDPKVARRERFVKQGARATGLFVKQRPGAKAGY